MMAESLATQADIEKGFKQKSKKMLYAFIFLILMILGLYAIIYLK